MKFQNTSAGWEGDHAQEVVLGPDRAGAMPSDGSQGDLQVRRDLISFVLLRLRG